MVKFGNDWDEILADEFKKPYYLELREFLKAEYSKTTVYPNMYNIFTALKTTSFADTKAVIIGQDPYHGPGQAHGLCFSVLPEQTPPPSLVNIYKELTSDLGLPTPKTGYLLPWAEQGVLMLNTVLTVRAGCAGSHRDKGWEIFTDRIIAELNKKDKTVVFLLWGAFARKKAAAINNPIHKKLCAPHPSPLSAYSGFFGCRCFSAANRILEESGQAPIDWSL